MAAQLEQIAETLLNRKHVEPVTVREFLSWYDARRRGHNVVASIRDDLDHHDLRTIPDFEGTWIDGLISLALVRPRQRQDDLAEQSRSRGETAIEYAPPLEPTLAEPQWIATDPSCSIPDDHIDPRRSALFMARSILRDVREGVGAC